MSAKSSERNSSVDGTKGDSLTSKSSPPKFLTDGRMSLVGFFNEHPLSEQIKNKLRDFDGPDALCITSDDTFTKRCGLSEGEVSTVKAALIASGRAPWIEKKLFIDGGKGGQAETGATPGKPGYGQGALVSVGQIHVVEHVGGGEGGKGADMPVGPGGTGGGGQRGDIRKPLHKIRAFPVPRPTLTVPEFCKIYNLPGIENLLTENGFNTADLLSGPPEADFVDCGFRPGHLRQLEQALELWEKDLGENKNVHAQKHQATQTESDAATGSRSGGSSKSARKTTGREKPTKEGL